MKELCPNEKLLRHNGFLIYVLMHQKAYVCLKWRVKIALIRMLICSHTRHIHSFKCQCQIGILKDTFRLTHSHTDITYNRRLGKHRRRKVLVNKSRKDNEFHGEQINNQMCSEVVCCTYIKMHVCKV